MNATVVQRVKIDIILGFPPTLEFKKRTQKYILLKLFGVYADNCFFIYVFLLLFSTFVFFPSLLHFDRFVLSYMCLPFLLFFLLLLVATGSY